MAATVKQVRIEEDSIRSVNKATKSGRTVGHEFAVEFDLVDVNGCTLEWWERTNVPYHEGMKAGEWTDMRALHPDSDVFKQWEYQRRYTPVGPAIFRIIDPPGIMVDQTQARELYFDIRVIAADTRRHATGRQELIVDKSGRGQHLIRFRILHNDVECAAGSPSW